MYCNQHYGVVLLHGLICVIIEVVTSHHLLWPFPPGRNYNVSTINAANITEKTVVDNLKRNVYRFRNATATLKDQYIPPSGKRITNRHVLKYLSTKTIAELSEATSFNSTEMNTTLVETYHSFSTISSCLELIGNDEKKFGHSELSKYITEAQKALSDVQFDLHTTLHTWGIGLEKRQYDCVKISCRMLELNDDHCKHLNRRMTNRQLRSYRDYIIINQSLAYVKRLFEQ